MIRTSRSSPVFRVPQRALRTLGRRLATDTGTLEPAARTVFRREGAARVTRRMTLVLPLVALISVAHVVGLWPQRGLPGAGGQWASDLVGVHLTMAGASLLLLLVTVVLSRRERAFGAKTALGVAVGWTYLGLTGYLAGVDQRVTSNITPFIVGSLAVATLVPLRPVFGLLGHLAAFVLFVWINDLHQTDAIIRLSNRGNALAISVIAYVLARVLEAARAEELKARLVNERQKAALEAANEELNRLATRDALTGLENRRSFLASARRLQAQAARSGRPVSVLMLDIDHFKAVNDRRGHAAGDEALCAVASACLSCLRVSDALGRTGGEEFAAVLPDTTVEAAVEVAQRIRARVESLRPLSDDDAFSVTICVGVSSLEPEASDAVARALARADAALYLAKAQGRNRVVRHHEAAGR